MTCDELRERIACDDAREPEVREHLDACPACRERAAALEVAGVQLRGIVAQATPLSRGVRDKVIASIEPPRRIGRLTFLSALAAAAAGVAIWFALPGVNAPVKPAPAPAGNTTPTWTPAPELTAAREQPTTSGTPTGTAAVTSLAPLDGTPPFTVTATGTPSVPRPVLALTATDLALLETPGAITSAQANVLLLHIDAASITSDVRLELVERVHEKLADTAAGDAKESELLPSPSERPAVVGK